MSKTLRTAKDLLDAGLIEADGLNAAAEVAARYAVAVTPAMAGLIDRDDPADPIARQFIPDARELDIRDPRNWPIPSAMMPTRRCRGSCTATRIACC